MARYRVLSWRGIPAQVKARDPGGRTVSVQLPAWFGQEIDRVAMRDGVIGTEAYLSGWDWSAESDRAVDAEEVAGLVAVDLAADWGHAVGASAGGEATASSKVCRCLDHARPA